MDPGNRITKMEGMIETVACDVILRGLIICRICHTLIGVDNSVGKGVLLFYVASSLNCMVSIYVATL